MASDELKSPIAGEQQKPQQEVPASGTEQYQAEQNQPNMPEGSPAQQERPQSPEQQRPPEQRKLKTKEGENFLDEAIGALSEKLRSKKKKIKQLPQVRDELAVKIEHIMEEGLADAYRELTPVEQQEFKIKGESVALEIRGLLKRGKLKMKTVFALLVGWLKMLPGVNKFFIEQEAKIKADKILSLHKK